MRSGRRASRSTHAPARKPTSRTARLPATTRAAISFGPAPRTRTASSGIAVRVTTDPSSDTVWPAQSFMKSACRQSVVVGMGWRAYPAPGRPIRRCRPWYAPAMARMTVNELVEAARSTIDRLDPSAAAAEADNGAVIIDTRCAELRRDEGIIRGAVHVPLSVLYWRLDPASGFDDPTLSNPDRRLILVCAHGYSSSLAAATLRQLGFSRATDIVGGFEAWQQAGLPVERLAE